MQKTKHLLLLRHAESDWNDTDINDHDRPLNKLGFKEALEMGRLLKSNRLVPDKIISSSAKRAVDTANCVSETCGYSKDNIEINSSLYATNKSDYLNVISNIATHYSRPLIVGHNPALENLVEALTNRIETIPTCTLVKLEMNLMQWSSIENSNMPNVNANFASILKVTDFGFGVK
jgi:phosphohistidine phosphatase